MDKVISKDGTTIAYDRSGQGPALIFVTGAVANRSAVAPVAARLARRFTVFAYDRRGRGDSGDTAPYAVEREIDDLNAIIQAAGGSACVFGHSSGAVLALDAANRLPPPAITNLAVYEPPILVDNSRAPLPDNYVARLNELVASGRRGEAVEYHLRTGIRIPEPFIAAMRQQPIWAEMEAVAPTLAYDGAIVAGVTTGQPLPKGQWSAVTIPTLVMNGGKSPAMMASGAQALLAILPHAAHRLLPDQDHSVPAEVLAPVLVEFFLG